MTNKHLTEIDIEKLAIQIIRGVLKDDLKPAHLNDCEMCSNRFKYYVEYYTLLNIELKNSESGRLESFISSLDSKKILELFYIKDEVFKEDFISDKGSLILAATTMEVSQNRFTKIAVFSSTDGNWLIRIIKDEETEKLLVYLLGNLEYSRIYQIQIHPINGHTILIITDENGFAELPNNPDFNWEELKITIEAK